MAGPSRVATDTQSEYRFTIANVVEPVEPVWLASPAYVALAVAVPTFVFAE